MKMIAYFFAAVAVALVSVGIVVAFGSTSAAVGHGMAATPNLSGIGSVLVNLAIVAVITAIVSPIKQRLGRNRQAGAPAGRQPSPRSTSLPV